MITDSTVRMGDPLATEHHRWYRTRSCGLFSSQVEEQKIPTNGCIDVLRNRGFRRTQGLGIEDGWRAVIQCRQEGKETKPRRCWESWLLRSVNGERRRKGKSCMDEQLWSEGMVFGAEVFRAKTNSGNVLRTGTEVE